MAGQARAAGRVVLTALLVAVKMAWVASMVLVPLVGMWLSSSLAAYHNRSIWMCAGLGLLLFPILPLAWESLSLWRARRRATKKKPILTGLDRLVLRTLALNLSFVGVLLYFAPEAAYRAISTRGDWVFDGYDGPISRHARSLIFAIGDSLESRLQKASEVYGKSDRGPEEDDRLPPPPPVDDEAPTPNAQQDTPLTHASDHWPIKAEIDDAISEMPEALQTDLYSVAAFIETRFPDPFERTRAIHDYIILRLAYDYDYLDRMLSGDDSNRPSQLPEDVFASRIAVCEGYARLMQAMAKEAGLEVAYIVGNARIEMRESEGILHAWNAVKVEQSWYLMDVTWDDGTMERHRYTHQTTYLFTPPELFGMDHLPEEASWQLRDTPISMGEFMRQPDLRPDFALYDFELIAPTRSQVTVEDKLQMTIGNPRGAFLLASYQPKGGGAARDCEIQAGDPIEVTCRFDEVGEYLVTLFANTEPYGSFEEVGKQLVNR